MRSLPEIEGELGSLYLELMQHANAQTSHERHAHLAGIAEQAVAAHNSLGEMLADDRRRAHLAKMAAAQIPMFEEIAA
jgi:hypothetical protein